MKSLVIKRSIIIGGHKTSVSLEDAFWRGLKQIARDRQTTLSELVTKIDGDRSQGNLSSSIRLFVLDHFRIQLSALGAAAQPVLVPPASASVGRTGDLSERTLERSYR